MRPALGAVLLLGAAALGGAQPMPPPAKEAEGAEPVPRYGVSPRVKAYPQNTPKAALRSVLTAIDKGEYAYLAAQLLDPKFVDDAAAERAKAFEAGAEAELTRLRDYQRANRDKVADEDRVPLDGPGFRALVAARAHDRGFKQLARDVERKLTDDPQAVRDFRRVLRDGAFADADATASATHPDLKGKTLFFKKLGARWFLENRQAEEPKKEP
jgi:hypothetical protein